MEPISIIIPVYNEAENIEALHTEIMEARSAYSSPFEIIFVDDGSLDNTAHILKALSTSMPALVYLSHKRNYGQSAAIISGVKKARYPWIVTLDGDGQNDPGDIECLLATLKKQPVKTVVFGNRHKRNDEWLRILSSRIGNRMRRALLNDDSSDTGCSLKLFPREAFLALPHFNHLHRFLPALFKRAGFKIVNIAVHHRPRKHGVSKYGVRNRLWIGIFDLLGVYWLMKRPCEPEMSHFE